MHFPKACGTAIIANNIGKETTPDSYTDSTGPHLDAGTIHPRGSATYAVSTNSGLHTAGGCVTHCARTSNHMKSVSLQILIPVTC